MQIYTTRGWTNPSSSRFCKFLQDLRGPPQVASMHLMTGDIHVLEPVSNLCSCSGILWGIHCYTIP